MLGLKNTEREKSALTAQLNCCLTLLHVLILLHNYSHRKEHSYPQNILPVTVFLEMWKNWIEQSVTIGIQFLFNMQ